MVEEKTNNLDLKRIVQIVLVVVLLVGGIILINEIRKFDSYDTTSAIERKSSGVTQYEEFHNYLLEYSNDGISCLTDSGEVVWNQAFEMIAPKIEICGEYLGIYDAGGTEIFILTEAGLQKEIKTTVPIQTMCIAQQGTVAVLMKENKQAQVKLFDVKGKELANGKFYAEKGGFPIDIALSHDGTKLAVDMVDVSKGNISTTINFYNFGSVGQSEIDNNVGTYTFENILVPEIEYISNSRMIGLGTGKLLVFAGAQKPELTKEIEIKEEILSCFYNEKYIGIVYDNVDEENLWHLKVMDMRGFSVMESDISVAYDRIEFLSNNEVCVSNATECEIFTIHGVKKFKYTFDEELYKILAGDTKQNYTFIFRDTIEEVKLK